MYYYYIFCSIIGICITLIFTYFIYYHFHKREYFNNNPPEHILQPGEDPIPIKPEELTGYEHKPGSMYQLANIQGTKRKGNWCRIVRNIENHSDQFITCSLKDIHNKYPYWFKSANKREGFLIGRHGYMKDINESGIDSYCRILSENISSVPYGQAPTWDVKCNLTEGLELTSKIVRDPEPPENITNLLKHYEGCIAWFAWNTPNKNEFIRNLNVLNNGGVTYHAKNGYIWDGIKSHLTMYENIPWNHTRTICCWVKMNENTDINEELIGTTNSNKKYFKRWSKIFDFYKEPYNNHFFLGNEDITGNLVMECWHGGSRAMRLVSKDFFKPNQWVHICITTEDIMSINPTWIIYKNGIKIDKHTNGKLPSNENTTIQQFGKSGDIDDEYFSGSIKDLRFYEYPFNRDDVERVMNFSYLRRDKSPPKTT